METMNTAASTINKLSRELEVRESAGESASSRCFLYCG